MPQSVSLILETIWLLLPAGAANIAPVIAAKFNWAPPLGKPILPRFLGAHKTWRGLFFGLTFGSVTGLLLGQGFVYGAALGFGALLGDSVKSFFKRRLNIPPGKPWPVFDQVDFVIGALIIASLFFSLTFIHITSAIIIFGLLSWLCSYVGLKLKIKINL